jgi:hypothetical protein
MNLFGISEILTDAGLHIFSIDKIKIVKEARVIECLGHVVFKLRSQPFLIGVI